MEMIDSDVVMVTENMVSFPNETVVGDLIYDAKKFVGFQFEDGSIKAQMGLPDMRLPFQYALSYPERLRTSYPRLDFKDYQSLTFVKPDTKTFRNLALAFEVGRSGGNQPCILNAANEIAVEEFLRERIGFLEITDIIEKCLGKVSFIKNPTLDDLVSTDKETRLIAKEFIN